MKIDMTLKKKDVKLLIILAGLAVLLLSYVLVYRTYTEKRDAAESEIATLQPELDQLREYEANRPEYEEKTREAKQEISKVLAKLPAEVNPEDEILYTTDLERKLDIDANTIGFSDPAVLNQFSGVTPDNIDDSTAMVDMTSYTKQTTLDVEMDYTKMKNLLNEVYNNSVYLTGVNSIAVTYNAATSGLDGTVVLDRYYINYDGQPPYETSLPATTYGAPNPFGTLDTTQQ